MRPCILTTLCFAAATAAAPPSYHVVYLGESVQVSGINQKGDMIGGATLDNNTRAWVSLAGAPFQPLPLPPGMASSLASDINDAGEIVGAVSETFSAYDFPYAVVWRPGPNGYEVEDLEGHHWYFAHRVSTSPAESARRR